MEALCWRSLSDSERVRHVICECKAATRDNGICSINMRHVSDVIRYFIGKILHYLLQISCSVEFKSHPSTCSAFSSLYFSLLRSTHPHRQLDTSVWKNISIMAQRLWSVLQWGKVVLHEQLNDDHLDLHARKLPSRTADTPVAEGHVVQGRCRPLEGCRFCWVEIGLATKF